MLTYQCRVVLRELKKLTNNTDANFCYLFCTHSFSLDNPDACSTKHVNQGFKGLGNQK